MTETQDQTTTDESDDLKEVILTARVTKALRFRVRGAAAADHTHMETWIRRVIAERLGLDPESDEASAPVSPS